MQWRDRQGFTLIELSITLVIIGLIVAGIMTGRSLIEGATIRKQASEFERYNTITNTFKIKYGCLPGDCENQTRYGFDVLPFALTCSLGDGYINHCNDNSMEMWAYWRHLFQAEMNSFSPRYSDIWGAVSPYTDGRALFPTSLLSNAYIIGPIGGIYKTHGNPNPALAPREHNYFAIVNDAVDINVRSLLPIQMYMLDAKMDDGLPLTGKVQAYGYYYGYGWSTLWRPAADPYSSPASVGAAGSSNCVSNSTTPNSYNVTNSDLTCDGIIQAGF